ncbi:MULTISPECIES: hypothetical protein [Methylobacterium]|uniref:Uncharacterized protein n=1 Tax=Methylobacterium jeotgali TaxID=381630 RepID=A0ABQ4SYB2_9HYPH|nr:MULTISPECIES: hypothetical protein [Methylobacterium]PIU06222.1 MAG: hypothetical protein COT56_10365 [Methylobacterium sp. CG09_land_8_20_14_0_10_71_15]PIU14513.1 MAG: hypothetical protein COT28_07630 [Methylobacterium sp. CG08_land_8_20_14_0_20_71_15]GJE07480.1 hypothetical protein AOPFMNJM_2809 [Methylobacterium jeotgali]
MRRAARALALLGMLPCATFAADLDGPFPAGPPGAPYGDPVDLGPPTPRYFPRGDGADEVLSYPVPRRRVVGCIPRRALVPTNAPDDPSFVGSEYGLSRPSYYGMTPPRGVDDPFGRPVLPYCR